MIEVRIALSILAYLAHPILTRASPMLAHAQPEASWFARVQGGDAHPLEWAGEQQSFS